MDLRLPTFIKVVEGVWVNPAHIVTIRNNTINLLDGKVIYVDLTADQILETLKNGQ